MEYFTIYTSEAGTRSTHVAASEAAAHINARGAYATEAQLLLAFIAAEQAPRYLADSDGDAWELVERDTNDNDEDYYIYEIVE
jgi:hypothetical protein